MDRVLILIIGGKIPHRVASVSERLRACDRITVNSHHIVYDKHQLHQAEHDYYHRSDRSGFFSILTGRGNVKQQRSYKLEMLPEVISQLDHNCDTYISQGEFFKPNRQLVNLARIGLCYVDLDYYTVPELRDLTSDQITGLIELYCNDNGLPMPSMIMASGCGIYLKWYLRGALPSRALPRWNAVQNALVKEFEHFGADRRAKDASRVLRLQLSVNTKNGKLVLPIGGTSYLYDFEDLCSELLPVGREELRQLQEHRHELRQEKKQRADLKVLQGGNKPVPGLRSLSDLQLNWDRLADLRHLAALRGGVQPGHRDVFLFLATCFSCWFLAPATLESEIAELGREFAPDFSGEQIREYTSSAIARATAAGKKELQEYLGHPVDPRYKFKNQTLIDWLDITPAEERQLQTIICGNTAKERDRQRAMTKRRDKGADSRDTYLGKCQAGSEVLRTEMLLRRARGKSFQKIADEMHISKAAVVYHLKRCN